MEHRGTVSRAPTTHAMSQPPLGSLHPDGSLSQPKLQEYQRLSTQVLIASLAPGQTGALKARPDGTIMDGHHRIKILRDRGIDVDSLPREVLSAD
jgi:hypothetical protein